MLDLINAYENHLVKVKQASNNTVCSYLRDIRQFSAWLQQKEDTRRHRGHSEGPGQLHRGKSRLAAADRGERRAAVLHGQESVQPETQPPLGRSL